MNKSAMAIVTALLTAAAALLTPAAVSADIAVPAKKTVYLVSAPARDTSVGLDVSGIAKKTKITGIKSSVRGVLRVDSAFRTDQKISDIFSAGKAGAPVSESAVHMDMTARKEGKATVSFKAGGKKYKILYEVLKYRNPVKSLRFTGYGSTNLKKVFAKDSINSYELKKSAKAGSLKVACAGGWKIRSVLFTDMKTGREYSLKSEDLTSASLRIPAMKKGGLYDLRMVFENAKNGGTEELLCSIF